MVLSICGQNAYKEFALPPGKNLETSLTVRRDVFGLPRDLALRLENSGGRWSFLAPAEGELIRNGALYDRAPLQDGDYLLYRQQGRNVLAIMARDGSRRFTGYAKYALQAEEVLIGTAPECGIRYSFQYGGAEYITRRHASIRAAGGGLSLRDYSRNGVFVNDVRVHGEAMLQFGDHVDIWGLHMVALGGVLAVREDAALTIDPQQLRPEDLPEQPLSEETAGKIHYHRSPRRLGRLAEGEIAIDPPPAAAAEGEQPLLLAVGPALSMALPMVAGSLLAVAGSRTGGAYMYTGIVTSVLSAVIGAVWAFANLRYARKSRREKEELRFSAYSDYLVRLTDGIRADYQHNREVMLEAYPSAAACIERGLRGERLWERNAFHPDFLCYRLGLGDIPFQKEIRAPGERFEMIPDTLRDKPRMIRENFHMLRQVPVCVDLARERLVGIVGGPDLAGARGILQGLVAQIAVHNCYTDVKLAFFYREDQGDDTEKWEYCRWLPHVWSEGHKMRFVADSSPAASDLLYEIASVLRLRHEMKGSGQTVYKPWYILVLEDSSLLENEPAARYLLDPGQDLGVTVLILADRAEDLPNACECIIRGDAAYTGMYHTREMDMDAGRIQIETMDRPPLERLARKLCSMEVEEAEQGGGIPASVTFFDLYGVSRPQELMAPERWKHGRTYENMRALVGVKNGGLPCCLDAHEKYHGPHGLVAGTTGSGKSETLQTYILSLAIQFSPYDVGFFLIDYKGGGMANLFERLPHTLGTISNLSGGQIQRALVSIKSENQRRQRLFNESGVNNINHYTRLYKNGEVSLPIPHLFIIIDEFAELKREQQEFMQELISVAQVGRSLGVHLILATQKPAGTVDDNIRSNTRFRLCLRVQDRQDSMDMLHRPDAAYLTQAGRAFLQVGSDEVFEQFQSGWSGADFDAETAGSKQVLARMLASTGRMDAEGSYLKRQRKEAARSAWLALLADLCRQAAEEPAGPARTAALYSRMAEAGIDFPENEGNTHLLHGLMELAGEADARGLSGADAGRWLSETAAARGIRLPERKRMTQLDAAVEYLAAAAKAEGYRPLPPLWMEPLPPVLYLPALEGWEEAASRGGVWQRPGKRWELTAVVGKADDPQNQSQLPVVLNFSRGGHHALIGAVSSGKSTFVQTLIYSLIRCYPPDWLNLYILDYSGRMTQPLLEAPHIGGIFFEDDAQKTSRLFYLLRDILEKRKRLFQGGNYAQYILAHEEVCPAVLLVIDNLAGFREKTGEAYDQELIRLAREGAAYGVYLFVTAAGFGISEIPSRLGDQIRSTLCLSLPDSFQYGEALRVSLPAVLPEAGVPGRGLVLMDGRVLEFQTALALEAEDSYALGEKLRQDCRGMREGWKGKGARMVPFIPDDPSWEDLAAREEAPELFRSARYLPIGYDAATAGIYSVDLRYVCCYTVSGRARSGKTGMLKLWMRSAREKKMRISLIEPEGTALQAEAERLGAQRAASLDEIVAFIWELGGAFRARHEIRREMTAQGKDEDAQFDRMCREEPWLVVISDLTALARLAGSPEAAGRNLGGALANLFGKGFLHNIYFVAGYNPDDRARAAGTPVFEEFVKDRAGCHLGGNVAAQQLLEFGGMPFKEQNRPEKPGIALIPPQNGAPYRRVILPQVRR